MHSSNEFKFFRYKTGNNIDASEQGFLKDFSDEHPHGVLVQHGEYTYTGKYLEGQCVI